MSTHENALNFAHVAEQSPRLKELAHKQDTVGLTDDELDEFIDLCDNVANDPFMFLNNPWWE